MKIENVKSLLFVAALALSVGISCDRIGKPTAPDYKPETETKKTAESPSPKPSEPAKKESNEVVSQDDQPDFTLTADEIFKEYKAAGTEKYLEVKDKYKGKLVQISGRFFESDNKETDGDFGFRLKAGSGMFDWVNCKVDPENKERHVKFKKNQPVTFKGIGGDFWIGGPSFDNCIIIDGK